MTARFAIIAAVLLGSSISAPTQAASSESKPVLKAIDPSNAKFDRSTPPPPSPNPLGRITGAPVSQQGKRSPYWPSTDVNAQPTGQDDIVPSDSLPPPAPPLSAYPVSPPAAYPNQYYPQGNRPGLPPPAPPSRYRGARSGYPTNAGYPSAPPQTYPSNQQYPSAPGGTAGGTTYPSEDMIPEFGKELPFNRIQPPPNAYQPDIPPNNPGAAWSTQAPQTLYGTAPATIPEITPEERQVTRLEQIAFGSTYPEHEVPDRVDHLEKEVFGKVLQGNLSARLGNLETKLAGQGAFGQQAIAPPAVAPSPNRDPG